MARIFAQIKGHEKIIERLMQALRMEKVAHTYLFIGPEGVGKSLVAWGFAQALACDQNKGACGECPSCLRIEKRQSEALLWVQPTKTQLNLEDTQKIKDFIAYKSLSKARVIVLDQAHLLNPQASNSLLKILEEPPENTYFLMISPSLGAVLPTLRSRSQIVRFGCLNLEDIKTLSGAEDWIVRSSQGSMVYLQQFLNEGTASLRKQAVRFIESCLNTDEDTAREVLEDLVSDQKTSQLVVRFWLTLCRDAVWQDATTWINVDLRTFLLQLQKNSSESLNEWAQETLQLETDLHQNLNRSLLFENYWQRVNVLLTSVVRQ